MIDLGLIPNFHIATAGDIAKKILTDTYQGKKIFLFGLTQDTHFLQSLRLHTVYKLEDADIALLSTYPNDRKSIIHLYTWIAMAAELKIPVLCANPDIISPHGNETKLCAGYVAKLIKEKGGNVIFSGKPHPIIYQQLFTEFDSNKSQMIMIGDSLETDIEGANRFGIDSLLILSGNMGNYLKKSKVNLLKYLEESPKGTAHPKFFADSLIW